MSLTEAQERTLRRMKDRENRRGKTYSTAQDVGATMRTMYALLHAGLIIPLASAEAGSLFFPREVLRYRVARAAA